MVRLFWVLGNLGALGSKPVMEGKAVLFKRFADVNSVLIIEVDTEDPDEFCKAVKLTRPHLWRYKPRRYQSSGMLSLSNSV